MSKKKKLYSIIFGQTDIKLNLNFTKDGIFQLRAIKLTGKKKKKTKKQLQAQKKR